MTTREYHEEFRIRFTALMDDAPFSQSDLAKRLGLASHTTVTAWKTGRGFPKPHSIRQMIMIFDVPAEHLMCTAEDDR